MLAKMKSITKAQTRVAQSQAEAIKTLKENSARAVALLASMGSGNGSMNVGATAASTS